ERDRQSRLDRKENAHAPVGGQGRFREHECVALQLDDLLLEVVDARAGIGAGGRLGGFQGLRWLRTNEAGCDGSRERIQDWQVDASGPLTQTPKPLQSPPLNALSRSARQQPEYISEPSCCTAAKGRSR